MPALITLTATRRFTGSVCIAMYTLPMPPSPITSTNLYLPPRTVPIWVRALGMSLVVAFASGSAVSASSANDAVPPFITARSLAASKALTRARSSLSAPHRSTSLAARVLGSSMAASSRNSDFTTAGSAGMASPRGSASNATFGSEPSHGFSPSASCSQARA